MKEILDSKEKRLINDNWDYLICATKRNCKTCEYKDTRWCSGEVTYEDYKWAKREILKGATE